MVKKKEEANMEDIPTLEEAKEEAKEETQEKAKEEDPYRVISNEQLLHLKLDKLEVLIQDLGTKLQQLIEILVKRK